MKKLLLILLVILAVVGAIGFYMFNKTVPTLESEKADYSLTANELFNSYDQNESAAEQKYADKVIQVTGVVEGTKLNDSIPSLILAAENAMMGGVNCAFSEKVAGIKTGDTVVVKGRCQGYLMNVILNNCTLVN